MPGFPVAVAVPLPFQAPFTYRMPEGEAVPQRGVRVVVPFGGRRVIGAVIGPATETADLVLKDVQQVLDEAALVPPPLLDLAAWVAEHYLAPPGECYRLVMPPAGVRASKATVRLVRANSGTNDPVVEALREGPLRVSVLARRLGRDPEGRLGRLRKQGIVAIEQDLGAPGFRDVRVAVLGDAATARGFAQKEVLARLREAGGRARVADLVRDRPALRGAIDRLVRAGSVRIVEERDVRHPEGLPAEPSERPVPSFDQARALESLVTAVETGGFAPFLLHGITGRGKTEVYFRAAEAALARGRGALILVPEIALTPLLVRAANARFGRIVSVLHSELSAGERHDQWWRIREGDAPVVVGARSAVFAPLPEVGLLVVDEEHDGAYKQEDSPRYHARDVAVMRGQLEGAPVVLGSATPSVESHANAEKGKYKHLVLPCRIGRQGLPKVEVVDRRAVLRAGGDPILSPVLREALAARLTRGEQSLLLLNRRGGATRLLPPRSASPAAGSTFA